MPADTKKPTLSRGTAMSDLRFKRAFGRRAKEKVQNPRDPTDLARALAQVEDDHRQPSRSFADRTIRRQP